MRIAEIKKEGNIKKQSKRLNPTGLIQILIILKVLLQI